MSVKSMSDIEEYVERRIASLAIGVLLKRFGIEVQITRTVSEGTDLEASVATKDVYGVHSGLSGGRENEDDIDITDNVEFQAKILMNLTQDQPFDDMDIGALESFDIYTEDELFPGDEFYIPRYCDLKKKFRVIANASKGTTRRVVNRYIVSSMGGDSEELI